MTQLDKILHMSGKELFAKVEANVESGKITRSGATTLYKTWLESRNHYHSDNSGWVRYDDTVSVAKDIGII